MVNYLQLSNQATTAIFSYVDIKSLVAVSATCHQWKKISESEE